MGKSLFHIKKKQATVTHFNDDDSHNRLRALARCDSSLPSSQFNNRKFRDAWCLSLPELPVRATYLRQLGARKPIHSERRSVVTEEYRYAGGGATARVAVCGRPLPNMLESRRTPTKNKLNTTNTYKYKILPTICIKVSGKVIADYGELHPAINSADKQTRVTDSWQKLYIFIFERKKIINYQHKYFRHLYT